MRESDVAARWDEEYRSGRYVDEEAVPFVHDIVAAVRRHGLPQELGLYIGCGNGRNYVPLVDAGLDLIGLDLSGEAIAQLARRRPDRAHRLVRGDLAALPADRRFGTVIGIQVFQHGDESRAHAHIAQAADLLVPGGLLCVRVNAVGTQHQYEHSINERNASGGFTITYAEGPKRGLAVHFFARAELASLLQNLEPILPLRIDRTYRTDPAAGHWDQWEGIWRMPSRS